MNGGDRIAEVLGRQGVKFLFTLCGGHISPILVGAKRRGVRVVDVRHEATAVFAADAVARLTGVPGVAAVTAGPGVTNTITAIKNAQMAQSPIIVIGGAAATVLKGRGALQDIDHLSLLEPLTKWATSVGRVRDLVPTFEEAFEVAQSGVPGPVFIECPIDLLYDEKNVREFYGAKSNSDIKSIPEFALQTYLKVHVARIFAGADRHAASPKKVVRPPTAFPTSVKRAADLLGKAQRPVALIGSQAMLQPDEAPRLVDAISTLGIPVYLSGMARGLMGAEHPQLLRHRRRQALRKADLVILAGVPCDFRLEYGRHIGGKANIISVNRSGIDVKKNRKPTLPIIGDPGHFLCALADKAKPQPQGYAPWLAQLRSNDDDREAEIREQAAQKVEPLNPLAVCKAIDDAMDDDSVIVVDGGDFAATAAYITAPRGPLRWLDPGAFGTLGVGAGFALGAKLCRPDAEIWIVYGDGSVGYSMSEFDTFVRHEIPVIAVVGNDASWAQIARDQVVILEDDVGTVLRRSDYHIAAQGFGGQGFVLDKPEDLAETLHRAKAAAKEGKPVLINAHIGRTEFRKGSISV